jgi:hypothetical protein
MSDLSVAWRKARKLRVRVSAQIRSELATLLISASLDELLRLAEKLGVTVEDAPP